MRIGIDARNAINVTDGTGRYTVELLKAFSQIKNDNQYLILKSPSLNYSLKFDQRFHEIVVPLKRFSIKEQIVLPILLSKLKLDLFHSLHITFPILYKGKAVITIHDIMPILMPWFFGVTGVFNKIASIYFSFLVNFSVKNATRIITDSEHTLLDIKNKYNINSDRLCRIYLGIDHIKLSNNIESEYKNHQLSVSKPFIATITNFRPYKNIPTLIKAFQIVKKKIPNIKLMIIGKNEKYLKRTLGKFSKSELKNIQFLGFISDKDLIKVLNSADAFVFPSLYEGFGFPILEAMVIGTPVITSPVASLSEVGGDAVIYVNPLDEKNIAEEIIRIYSDKSLKNYLSEKGKIQAAKFKWEETARKTLEIYDMALKNS